MQLYIFIVLYANLKKIKFQSDAACSKAKQKSKNKNKNKSKSY